MPSPAHPHPAVARPGDQGTITVWILGLVILLFFVGGLSLDLWRVFSERLALANAADAASIAGASGIDVQRFRDSGVVVIDPVEAALRASDNLAASQSQSEDMRSLVAAPGIDVKVPGEPGAGPTGSI